MGCGKKNLDCRIYAGKNSERRDGNGGFFTRRSAGRLCCVGGDLAGETASYANLLLLFVDDRFKRHGIGRLLLQEACRYAKKLGAEKLFLSAIPSEDTIAFYQNMGCVDAKEIVNPFVDDEEDRLMEITTKDGN